MELEGALRIGLGVRAGRVESVRVTSTRPDVARLLLQGRHRREIRAALPRLFSVCGHSQAAAGELACAAAAGDAAEAAQARCRADVSAEIVREHAWCVLLDWPRAIGEEPGADAIAAARRADASRSNGMGLADADARAISIAAFGVPADEWLQAATARAFGAWVDEGRTASARFMRRMREAEAANAIEPRRDAEVGLLDGGDRRAAMVELWSACEADPDFPRRPTWHGHPMETGALARLRADPLIADLMRLPATRVLARFAARLRELAALLARRDEAVVGVHAMPSGGAAAWVETARGLLVHHVRLSGERAATYRIVAPTEWNFHPEGALAATLVGVRAARREALEERALRTVRSLDPCVACRVEIEDA